MTPQLIDIGGWSHRDIVRLLGMVRWLDRVSYVLSHDMIDELGTHWHVIYCQNPVSDWLRSVGDPDSIWEYPNWHRADQDDLGNFVEAHKFKVTGAVMDLLRLTWI